MAVERERRVRRKAVERAKCILLDTYWVDLVLLIWRMTL